MERARLSGKPTFVTFSVIGCCDKMYPIVEDIAATYGERLNVVFVHIGEEEILSDLYGIDTIPVQLFFDGSGKELWRHTGFLPENDIVARFAEMGVK